MVYMKSPALRMFHHVLCWVTALGSLHVGLVAMGWNVFVMVPGIAMLAQPVAYLFGFAGLASLVMLVFHGIFFHCESGTCNR
jgi:uncharacterized membrane protein YuzA (DUF378 family)